MTKQKRKWYNKVISTFYNKIYNDVVIIRLHKYVSITIWIVMPITAVILFYKRKYLSSIIAITALFIDIYLAYTFRRLYKFHTEVESIKDNGKVYSKYEN